MIFSTGMGRVHRKNRQSGGSSQSFKKGAGAAAPRGRARAIWNSASTLGLSGGSKFSRNPKFQALNPADDRTTWRLEIRLDLGLPDNFGNGLRTNSICLPARSTRPLAG